MANTEKPRLQVKYEEVKKNLMTELNLKNINEVPKLEKIVLNMGLGEVKDNSKSFGISISPVSSLMKRDLYSVFGRYTVIFGDLKPIWM